MRWIHNEEIASQMYGQYWNLMVEDIPDAFFVNYIEDEPIQSVTDYTPANIVSEITSINKDKQISESINALRSDTIFHILTQPFRELVSKIPFPFSSPVIPPQIPIASSPVPFSSNTPAASPGGIIVAPQAPSLSAPSQGFGGISGTFPTPTPTPTPFSTTTTTPSLTPTATPTPTPTPSTTSNTAPTSPSTPTATSTQPVQDIVPPFMSNIRTSTITTSSITVEWTTDEPALGKAIMNTVNKETASETSYTTSHNVTLSNLMSGSAHSFYVVSTDSSGNSATSEVLTVTTATVVSGPKISLNIGYTESYRTYVGFDADQDVKVQYEYGKSSSLGMIQDVFWNQPSPYWISNGAYLINLIPGTQYYVRAKAWNKAGTMGTSDFYTFTTKSLAVPPVIHSGPTVTLTDIGAQKAVLLNFATDITCNGKFYWGTSTSYGSTVDIPNGTSFHYHLQGLDANTTYHVKASCTTDNGTVETGDKSFQPSGTAYGTVLGVSYSEQNPLGLKAGQLVKSNAYQEIFYVNHNICLQWIPDETIAIKYFGADWSKSVTIHGVIPETYKFCDAFQ